MASFINGDGRCPVIHLVTYCVVVVVVVVVLVVSSDDERSEELTTKG